MKYLITYIIISYPVSAIFILIRLKELKESFKKAMGGDAMASAGIGMAKGVYKKSGLNKTLKSPIVIIPLGIIALIAIPFLSPIFIYDIIWGAIKKLIKEGVPKKPYRARKTNGFWIIEAYEDGKWFNKYPDHIRVGKDTILNDVKILNDLARKKKESENVSVQ